MSRRLVILTSAVIMLCLAVLAALVLREPVDTSFQASAADMFASHTLRPALSFTAESAENLPVTSLAPGTESSPSGVAELTSDDNGVLTIAPALPGSSSPAVPDVTRSTLPSVDGENVVTAAVLMLDGGAVTLRMTGNAIRGNAFVLVDPDRVVLDIVGSWKLDLPQVGSNRMVAALRMGDSRLQDAADAQHTRVVFEMRVKPQSALVTQIDANTLEVNIR